MEDVAVIDDPRAAEISLDPVRARLLSELTEPASAAALARRLEQPRQKINYHLRSLEQHGLVEQVDERRKGNVMERLLRATSKSYVISPSVMGAVEPDPANAPDRLSATWLLAIASRLVREVGELIAGSRREGKRLASYALEGKVRFASPRDRAAFTAELTEAVTALVSKYHDESAPAGREHRVVAALHPVPPKETETEET
ncbi:MAG: winged helix-turn-helix domain-containing protein [Stackebrandtia sp.]